MDPDSERKTRSLGGKTYFDKLVNINHERPFAYQIHYLTEERDLYKFPLYSYILGISNHIFLKQYLGIGD